MLDSKQTSLVVEWEQPDIPNGNLTSYILRTIAVKTHASYRLLPSQTIVQGGASNSTILVNLHPGTKYNISVTALNADDESDPAYVLNCTLIGPPETPDAPKVIEKTDDTVTVLLSEGRSENGPLNAYQVCNQLTSLFD